MWWHTAVQERTAQELSALNQCMWWNTVHGIQCFGTQRIRTTVHSSVYRASGVICQSRRDLFGSHRHSWLPSSSSPTWSPRSPWSPWSKSPSWPLSSSSSRYFHHNWPHCSKSKTVEKKNIWKRSRYISPSRTLKLNCELFCHLGIFYLY